MCCLVLGSLGLIGSEEFLCCVELTCMVPELLLLPTHQGLVLFYGHIRLLLPGSRSQADSNTACLISLDDVRCIPTCHSLTLPASRYCWTYSIVLRQTSASPGTWPVIEERCACTNRFLLACIVRKLPAMRHRT